MKVFVVTEQSHKSRHVSNIYMEALCRWIKSKLRNLYFRPAMISVEKLLVFTKGWWELCVCLYIPKDFTNGHQDIC